MRVPVINYDSSGEHTEKRITQKERNALGLQRFNRIIQSLNAIEDSLEEINKERFAIMSELQAAKKSIAIKTTRSCLDTCIIDHHDKRECPHGFKRFQVWQN